MMRFMRSDGGIRPGPWAKRLRSACADPLGAFRDAIEEDAIVPWWPLVVACAVGAAVASWLAWRLDLVVTFVILGAPFIVVLLASVSTAAWSLGRLEGFRARWRDVFLAHVWALLPGAIVSAGALAILVARPAPFEDPRDIEIVLAAIALPTMACLTLLLAQAWRCSFGQAFNLVFASAGLLAGLGWAARELWTGLSHVAMTVVVLSAGGVMLHVARRAADERRQQGS